MRVVVTGATGNVGTSLVRALAAHPAVEAVVGVARRLRGWTPRHSSIDALRELLDAMSRGEGLETPPLAAARDAHVRDRRAAGKSTQSSTRGTG